MGIFGLLGNKKEGFKLYEGKIKTNFEFSNTIDGLDSFFYFISKKVESSNELENVSNTTINGVAHLFATEDIAMTVVNDANNKYGSNYVYYKSNFSLFLDDVVDGKIDGIVIYGIYKDKVAVLDKTSASDLKDLLTIYHALCQIKNGVITKEEGYTKIKNINVYFAINKDILKYVDSDGVLRIPKGAIISVPGNSEYITPYYDRIAFDQKDGQNIEGLRAFANEYSALKFGVNKEDICCMPLSELKEKSGMPVIIEPHRIWWVAF